MGVTSGLVPSKRMLNPQLVLAQRWFLKVGTKLEIERGAGRWSASITGDFTDPAQPPHRVLIMHLGSVG